MQVGDLVIFRQQPDPALGVIVEIDNSAKRGGHCVGISWSFLDWQIGWQRETEVEVVNESR
jgi:hypothetical protein